MERARALEKLAEMYWRQGKHGEAQPLLERALAIHEELSGPESIETAVALAKLACLYSEQGKDGESQLLCGHSLAISDTIIAQLSKSAGLDSPAGASSGRTAVEQDHELETRKLRKGLRLLALLYSQQSMRYLEQGKCDAAQPLLQRSMVMSESLSGPNSAELGMSLMRLAWLHRRQGKYAEAEEACKRVLQISERTVGNCSSETAMALNNLAVTCREQGKLRDAEALGRLCVKMYQDSVGEGREKAIAISNQAWQLCEQGDLEQAVTKCEQALRLCEKVLGTGHMQTVLIMRNLATILHRQEKFKEAGNLYMRCAAVLRNTRKHNHLTMSSVLAGWAANHVCVGQVDEAQKLYQQALSIALACQASPMANANVEALQKILKELPQVAAAAGSR